MSPAILFGPVLQLALKFTEGSWDMEACTLSWNWLCKADLNTGEWNTWTILPISQSRHTSQGCRLSSVSSVQQCNVFPSSVSASPLWQKFVGLSFSVSEAHLPSFPPFAFSCHDATEQWPGCHQGKTPLNTALPSSTNLGFVFSQHYCHCVALRWPQHRSWVWWRRRWWGWPVACSA